jgi:tetratricopeptide (TPR) repeat protein
MYLRANLILYLTLLSFRILSAQQLDSKEDSLKIDSLNNVSIWLASYGKIDEALKVNSEVEALVIGKYGLGSPIFGNFCYNKGLIYHYGNNFEVAERYYLEALEVINLNNSSLGKYNSEYLTLLIKLGDVNYSQGRIEKALEYYLDCRELMEEVFGGDHPDYILITRNLGIIFCEMYENDKAEKYLLEVIKANEDPLALVYLGHIKYSMSRYEMAEEYYLKNKEILERTKGKENYDYAQTLSFLGGLYLQMSRFELAEDYFRESESIVEKVFGKGHLNYAQTLQNLGRLFNFIGRHDKAEAYLITCKEIRENVLGKDHPDYAKIIMDLGNIYLSIGQYSKAEEYYQLSKNIFEKNFGKYNLFYAFAINSFGRLYYGLGMYEKSESNYLECKNIYENILGKDNSYYSGILTDLGQLYEAMGKFDRSEAFFLEGKAIEEKILGKSHLSYGTLLNNLGVLYMNKGQYSKAIVYLLESKTIKEKNGIVNNVQYSKTVGNLGLLYRYMGMYEEAEKNLLESLEICDKSAGKEHPHYSIILGSLGGLYELIGQFEKAIDYYFEAKTIADKTHGKDHSSYFIILDNLAHIYTSMNQFEEAERYYLESMEIKERSLGREHPYYSYSLRYLGDLFMAMGQTKQAEQSYLKSKAISNEIGAQDHPHYAKTLFALGELYYSVGNFKKAEQYFLDCKEIREKNLGREHPDFVENLSRLGALNFSMGSYGKAESYIVSSTRTIYLNLIQSVQFLSERDLGKYLKKVNAHLEAVPAYLRTGHFSNQMAELNYDVALFQKGFLQTAARRLNTLTAANPVSDSLSKTLVSCRAWLSEEYTKPVSDRSEAIVEVEKQANAIESQLARVVAGYAGSIKQVKWREVQATLRADEIAIEFVKFSLSKDTTLYAALLLRRGMEAPVYVELCDERDIDTLMIRNIDRREAYVSRLYTSSQRGLRPSEDKVRSLYELLWSPLEPYLQGVKTVYHSNVGLLHRINFGAITMGLDSVLADRFKLVELGSTRTLVMKEKETPPNNQALVMGGIKYDSDNEDLNTWVFALDSMTLALRSAVRFCRPTTDVTPIELWGELPYTSKEADSISLYLKKSRIAAKIFKGYNATEEAFYKSVRHNGTSPRIIHLATHGYFLPDPKSTDKKSIGSAFRLSEHPLIRSGLILAGGNQAWMTGQSDALGQEDGILTAYEISRLNLTGTELVVLSACETGLGDIQGNEGVYGLQRAFKIAGVRYVIMSLWQVPDQQSSIFMTTFYQRWLEQGINIPEAFRQTQAEMRKKGWSHHQWAGFVLLE